MAEKAQKGKKNDTNATGLDSWNEWHEHQYDPGHYLGGRQSPWLTGKRPNRFGYTLIGGGTIILLLVLFGAIMNWGSYGPFNTETLFASLNSFVGLFIFGILPILAGIRILRK